MSLYTDRNGVRDRQEVGEDVERGVLTHGWWDCELVQPLWKTAWRFLEKLKREPPYDPATPLWYLSKNKQQLEKRSHVHYRPFTMAETWEQPDCPSLDDWGEKTGYIHTTGHHSA